MKKSIFLFCLMFVISATTFSQYLESDQHKPTKSELIVINKKSVSQWVALRKYQSSGTNLNVPIVLEVPAKKGFLKKGKFVTGIPADVTGIIYENYTCDAPPDPGEPWFVEGETYAKEIFKAGFSAKAKLKPDKRKEAKKKAVAMYVPPDPDAVALS